MIPVTKILALAAFAVGAIAQLEATEPEGALARGSESSEWYTASNSGKFYISVTNRACDDVKIEKAAEVLSSTVQSCQVEGSEQFNGGYLDYGVTPYTPSGCGHYLVFYASPDTLDAVVRPSRRDANCGTCNQVCLNPFSSCNPPEWSRCSLCPRPRKQLLQLSDWRQLCTRRGKGEERPQPMPALQSDLPPAEQHLQPAGLEYVHND